MSEPWVRYFIKIMDSKIMDYHANTFKVFWILMGLAAWRDGPEVKRGQIRTTIKKLADQARLSENSVRGTLENLRKLHMTTLEGTRHGTGGWSLISIVNYNKYQYGGTGYGTREWTGYGTNRGTEQGTNKTLRSTSLRSTSLEKIDSKSILDFLENRKRQRSDNHANGGS